MEDANEQSEPSARDLAEGLKQGLQRALTRRAPLVASGVTQAWRAVSGESDGLAGLYLDVYGPGAVLILYEGQVPRSLDVRAASEEVLRLLEPHGVKAVYLKPFARDRSKLGGELPVCVTESAPEVGQTQPEMTLVQEHAWVLEIRLYDGLSTGIFLDQRENRRFVYEWVKGRTKGGKTPPVVLIMFAYTCAFSLAAAKAGAITASVDVSGRYLDWGKRNFAHNGLDPALHRFAKMDTFEFLGYALRKGLRFDLVILDPPSFASGSKKKGIRPWSSVADYSRLVSEAARVLNPHGVMFASTNTQELCRPGRLEREIVKGLGKVPRWIGLPEMPLDFARDRDRFAARAFVV